MTAPSITIYNIIIIPWKKKKKFKKYRKAPLIESRFYDILRAIFHITQIESIEFIVRTNNELNFD